VVQLVTVAEKHSRHVQRPDVVAVALELTPGIVTPEVPAPPLFFLVVG
jgi:hypothetical protein